MSDWESATDPVQRRELPGNPAPRRGVRRSQQDVEKMRGAWQRRKIRNGALKPTSVGTSWLDPDFDDMGA